MTKKPLTPLDAYLHEAGISDVDFAKRVGRDRSMINKIRRGSLKPTLEVAAAIERESGGVVTMQAWTDLPARAAA
jgi:ribosome-binding protein aMBF1 (putative translation factor)